LYNLIFMFLTADEKTKGSEPNDSKHYPISISSEFPPESVLICYHEDNYPKENCLLIKVVCWHPITGH
jgi:hypothetical protein